MAKPSALALMMVAGGLAAAEPAVATPAPGQPCLKRSPRAQLQLAAARPLVARHLAVGPCGKVRHLGVGPCGKVRRLGVGPCGKVKIIRPNATRP